MNNNETEDDEDDPWLRQFMAGAERREARARETGWGCAIFFGLFVLLLLMAIVH